MKERIINKKSDMQSVLDFVKKDISDLLNNTKKVSITVKQAKTNRTNAQNKLYQMWMREIEFETGNSSDYLKLFFRKRFLGNESYESKKGQTIEQIKSTTNLSTQEFTNYLRDIENMMSNNNIKLTQPEDYMLAMGRDK